MAFSGCGKALPEVTLSVWCPQESVEAVEQMITEFTELHADEAVFHITVSEEEELCKVHGKFLAVFFGDLQYPVKTFYVLLGQVITEFTELHADEAVFHITVSEEEELSCKETVLANPRKMPSSILLRLRKKQRLYFRYTIRSV